MAKHEIQKRELSKMGQIPTRFIDGIVAAQIVQARWAKYEELKTRLQKKEAILKEGDKENMISADVVCNAGFRVTVTINKENKGSQQIEAGTEIDILHDLFHDAVGTGNCKGPKFDFS